jgi:molecular chaperone HscB
VWHLVQRLANETVTRPGPFSTGPSFFEEEALSRDYFEVFELPRRLAVDGAALQRTFYALARRHHPDFHQAAPPEERARVEATSALVNAAYRTLRDPIARAEYLVRLEEGRDTKEGATERPKAPPALLAEMFEIQEALAEARAGALDEAARATLTEQRDGLRARLRDTDARVAGPLSARWDAAAPAERPAALAALKDALATRAYLRTVIEDLSEALGEEGPERVAHHRH